MQYSTALIALVASISAASAQTVCSKSVPYKFEIGVQLYNVTSTAQLTNADCTTNPIIELQDYVLMDQQGRTGEVVANNQFQFDSPLQKPRQYARGFTICSYDDNNGTVRLVHPQGNQGETDAGTTESMGPSSNIFYQCLSGGFSNLYDSAISTYCVPVWINIFQCAGSNTLSLASAAATGGSVVAQSSTAPASSSASTTTTSEATTSTPASSTPATSAPATSAPVSSIPAMTVIPPVAPFPTGNSTTPASTAQASSPTTTATTTTSSKPATFTPGSGASVLAIGGKIVAVAAGIAAFAIV